MSIVTTTADDGDPADDGKRRVVRWLKRDGATVAAGEVVCRVEADDGRTAEGRSPEAGVLRHGVPDGHRFAVGDDVFRIDAPPRD